MLQEEFDYLSYPPSVCWHLLVAEGWFAAGGIQTYHDVLMWNLEFFARIEDFVNLMYI